MSSVDLVRGKKQYVVGPRIFLIMPIGMFRILLFILIDINQTMCGPTVSVFFVHLLTARYYRNIDIDVVILRVIEPNAVKKLHI